ncbi:MAG: DDE-type integrase/transposase/recombinase [Nanoarchaeota archaeon]
MDFVWLSDLPNRRFFSNVINFAVDFYATVGTSLRTISKKMLEYFDIKISHENIRQCVFFGKKNSFLDERVSNCQTWQVDETYIKVKGKGYWIWVVYSKESQKVLAWHISLGRFFKDAKKVLLIAKERAGGRPDWIITDGLWQYSAAIKNAIGWNWRLQKKCHIIDSGIGKNAHVERVNKEIKSRIKWFGTFQSTEGARTFFEMFFHYFNLRTSKARSTG